MASAPAVDLGGTTGRLGLYLGYGGDCPVVEAVYKSREFSTIEENIALFFMKTGCHPPFDGKDIVCALYSRIPAGKKNE